MNRWHPLPEQLFALVERTPATVLLESSRPGATEHGNSASCSRLFTAPERILAAHQPAEIPALFTAIEQAVASGRFVAGFFSYECGACFEPKSGAALPSDAAPNKIPLAWFGVYEHCYRFDHATGIFLDGDPPGLGDLPAGGGHAANSGHGDSADDPAFNATLEAAFSLSASVYRERIRAIQEWIRAGDIYQLNFTAPLAVRTCKSPAVLYAALRRRQPVEFGAFLHWQAERCILSFSPELFFDLEERGGARRITTRPMKGTAPRGRTTAEDRAQAAWLRDDPKNRSENVMIVDLLRNDLGRLCRFGSVCADDLFAVERYPTLWQMTSTVRGTLRPDADFQQIFRALFPCGSVTGAPKVRAMQLIAQLEAAPRGVYTGAIGFFSQQRSVFNVAIRTLELELALESPSCDLGAPGPSHLGTWDRTNAGDTDSETDREPQRQNQPQQDQSPRGIWRGQMGVGSGIVADSVAEAEYRECLLKAEFLAGNFSALQENFSLIETLLWRDGFPLLELHLDRLEDSAEYFDFACDGAAIRAALLTHAANFLHPASPTSAIPNPDFSNRAPSAHAPRRVRLLLGPDGAPRITSELLNDGADAPDATSVRVCIARQRTNPADRMLFHKTTRRPLYAAAFNAAIHAGFADVLFLNLRGEVTEGAISNIFVEKSGQWSTPPIACGLLPGVFRRHLLATRAEIEERTLTADDLRRADAVYLANAVRGLRRVCIDWETVLDCIDS